MQQHFRNWLVLIFIIVGISGCNTNVENTANHKGKSGTLPVGYYSNEKHDRNNGNAILLDGNDNDGPLIEILDHLFGTEADK